MERECEMNDELVDLGTASVETKGGIGMADDFAGRQPLGGISDE